MLRPIVMIEIEPYEGFSENGLHDDVGSVF